MKANSDKGQCRACGEAVWWAMTDRKKRMPVNLANDPNGNLELWRDEFGRLRVTVVKNGGNISHFATCEMRVRKGDNVADVVPIAAARR